VALPRLRFPPAPPSSMWPHRHECCTRTLNALKGATTERKREPREKWPKGAHRQLAGRAVRAVVPQLKGYSALVITADESNRHELCYRTMLPYQRCSQLAKHCLQTKP
jgi:hypothetical protein